MYFINCFNAERDTSGSAVCVFTASAVKLHAYILDTFFKTPSVRDSANCESSGRLREVKNN